MAQGIGPSVPPYTRPQEAGGQGLDGNGWVGVQSGRGRDTVEPSGHPGLTFVLIYLWHVHAYLHTLTQAYRRTCLHS